MFKAHTGRATGAALSVWFGARCRWGPTPPAPRRYTLTHNDLTGELQLSVGLAYNTAQISSWYNRLIRCDLSSV
jgi:hypothetical protein